MGSRSFGRYEGLIAWGTGFLKPAESETLDCCPLARPGVFIEIFDDFSQGSWRGDGNSRVDIVTEEVSEEAAC